MKDRMGIIKNILTQGVCLKDRYIPDYVELAETVNVLRQAGHSISMTQGVYDLLHPGHVRYLEEAKSFGDILIVALDTDEYTKARKAHANERRPVVPFDERLELLAHLRSVSIITRRDLKEHKDNPYYVIQIVQPDVLVMSKSTKDITEEDHISLKGFCGRLEVLDAKAVISTTSRLRELLMDGAGNFADHMIKAIDGYFKNAGREFVIRGKDDK